MSILISKRSPLTMALVAASFAAAAATSGPGQVRLAADPKAVDLGMAPAAQVRKIAIALKLRDRDALVAYISSTTDRASPNFRKFLTPAQFAATYGQTDATIAGVRDYLAAHGITVTRVHANKLIIDATATNAQLASVFGAPIHAFSDAGRTYQRPVAPLALPAELSAVVGSVLGLSSQPLYKSHLAVIPRTGVGAAEATFGAHAAPKPGVATPNQAGDYTVADLAAQYNINPLYARGITGAGQTLGILTFAAFDPKDAFAYWAAVGLTVDPARITVVDVDGGVDPDAGIGSAGAGETTLDVEQSGGVAPGAKIIVYQAPNTDAGGLDLYAQAVSENKADTMSTSWGLFEIAYTPDALAAYDAVLLQAAAQGIPLSASSGDAGAYDINLNYPYPVCSTLLSVDFPASQPFVLAAGGTTLPGVIQRRYGTVQVPAERAWGWDYLRQYYVSHYGQAFYYANLFPVGGGGGVSVQYEKPGYQEGLAGTKVSAAAQSLFCNTKQGVADLVDLPVGVPGRNVPDVSLNADPFTGYSVLQDGQWFSGNGGTSFVAPQLNGIFALVGQQAGGRIGWPHPQLYAAFKKQGYLAGSPFRAISSGTNLFYASGPHYNPASGLGAFDVDNLAHALAP